jgi:hypothetical protein
VCAALAWEEPWRRLEESAKSSERYAATGNSLQTRKNRAPRLNPIPVVTSRRDVGGDEMNFKRGESGRRQDEGRRQRYGGFGYSVISLFCPPLQGTSLSYICLYNGLARTPHYKATRPNTASQTLNLQVLDPLLFSHLMIRSHRSDMPEYGLCGQPNRLIWI